MTIVTYAHRSKRPTRKKVAAAQIAASAILTIPSRKHAKLARALKAADAPAADPEATARVKGVLRPHGATRQTAATRRRGMNRCR
jgi:hypothetical protein